MILFITPTCYYNFVTLTTNLLAVNDPEAGSRPLVAPVSVKVTLVAALVLNLSAETPPENCVAVELMITLLAVSEKNN
jgi:hypothetical protein